MWSFTMATLTNGMSYSCVRTAKHFPREMAFPKKVVFFKGLLDYNSVDR